MIKKFEFGSEAIAYIRESLSHGDTYAQLLLRLPLESGQVVSYLPAGISAEASHRFTMSMSLTIGLSILDGSRSKIVEYMDAYLGSEANRLSVFETLARLGDRGLGSNGLQYFVYKPDIYFYLTSSDYDRQRIVQALKQARDYPFVAGLVSIWQDAHIKPHENVAINVLQELVECTEHILIGAYDAEGYLIWSR